ncbi:Branched-chain-amino-acid aminotransferase [Neolewinella maritima]|uniref:branched-chain-amino-acid transaminase n=1 Tax=Neolewinella maritima TaxID=1383882 RepID=A0ABN8F3W5_9BACT|nr:aminotransferase class IV [Neolewinella maritima]CAH0999460.1 Branched-chain-amino-acid aminotransferase [Neolewinella maritima]
MLQTQNPANDNLQVYIDGQLLHRDAAKISVFDSSVQGGDAVWEGLRVYNGRVFSLDAHLDRLYDSAHALWFQRVPERDTVIDAIRQTLLANDMRNDVHIRLTLTRGRKITSGMDPRLNQAGCTLIVLAEHKPPVYPESITLATSSVRRNPPMSVDSKIHHNNLINNILAKIEANQAGADAGLMLDKDGFVSEANGVNVFCIRRGEVRTPYADYCLPGITRATILSLCQDHGIPHQEARISVSEFYTADEVFTTGTMGELTRVRAIDGREIVNKHGASVLERVQAHFRELTRSGGTKLL